GGALAQVVAGQEAGEATIPSRDRAQAPDDHRIATLDIEGHGMAFRPVGGPELEAWGPAQDLLHLREPGVALRAKVQGNAVTRLPPNPPRGGRAVEVRPLQD